MITTIIPVYNSEKYLNQCIESVVNQTYKNLEIILVNDGSTDNSGNICNEWAKKDNRIHVIHKENSGVSDTRNTGINVAKGEYISFIDSDDYLDINLYEDANNFIDSYNPHIVSFGFCYINDSCIGDMFSVEQFVANNKVELKKYFNSFYKHLFGSACIKIYKKSMILDNNILFDKDIKLNEDAFFDFDAIECANVICNLDKVYYYYRQHVQSSSRKGSDKIIDIFIKRQNRYKQFIENMGYDSDSDIIKENSLDIGVWTQFSQAVISTNNLSFRQRLSVLKKIYSSNEYYSLLMKNKNFKTNTTALKICKLSAKLKMPLVAVIPVHIKKMISKGK